MAHVITIREDFVHVQFLGKVDALDIFPMLKDPKYLPNVSKLSKVICDFVSASDVFFSEDDAKSFAVLGNVESNFINSLHTVIVMKDIKKNNHRALSYINSLSSKAWKTDLAECLEHAEEMLRC
jgi:hypothetical protein